VFEELFTNPSTIQSYRAAPLVEPRERYLRHLAEAGASRLALRQLAADSYGLDGRILFYLTANPGI